MICCTVHIDVSRHLEGWQNVKILQSKVCPELFNFRQVYIYISLENLIDKLGNLLKVEGESITLHCYHKLQGVTPYPACYDMTCEILVNGEI